MSRPIAVTLGALWWLALPVAILAQAQIDFHQAGRTELGAALFLVAAATFTAGYWPAKASEPLAGVSDASLAPRSRWRRVAVHAPFLGVALIASSFALMGSLDSNGGTAYLWAGLWSAGALLAVAGQGRLAVAGALAVLVSYAFFGGNKVTAPGFALWLGGLALIGIGTGALPAAGRWLVARLAPFSRRGLTLSPYAVALLAIAALAAGLRFWQLDRLPAELGPDLPINTLIAQQIISGDFPVFTPAHPGREALFFYFVALLGKVFGLSGETTRIAGAMVGVASVVAIYFAGKELFGRDVGLWAALLLAVDKWALILSRTGLRFGLMPLFMAALLWTISRALRSGRRENFYLLGLILGLGMYTYNAWYMVVPLAGLLLVAQPVLWGRRLTRQHLALCATALGIAFLVFVPELRYAHDYPSSFSFRVASRVTGQEAALPTAVVPVFLDNLRRALLMFNYTGDSIFFSNVPHQRELGVFSGALLVLGAGYALARPRCAWHATLLVACLAMLLPSALAIAFPNEVPSAGRSSGAIVPAILLAALPPALLGRRAWGAWRRRAGTISLSVGVSDGGSRLWRIPLAAVLLAYVALVLSSGVVAETRETWENYFDRYANSQQYRNWSISAALAESTDRFLSNGEVYIVYRPHWYDGNAFRVNLKSPPALVRERYHELTVPLAAGQPPLTTLSGLTLFLVKADDADSQRLIESAFPGGVRLARHDFDARPQYYEYYLRR